MKTLNKAVARYNGISLIVRILIGDRKSVV